MSSYSLCENRDERDGKVDWPSDWKWVVSDEFGHIVAFFDSKKDGELFINAKDAEFD
jgi:hypothetical protein